METIPVLGADLGVWHHLFSLVCMTPICALSHMQSGKSLKNYSFERIRNVICP